MPSWFRVAGVCRRSSNYRNSSAQRDCASPQFALTATVPFTNACFFQIHNPISTQTDSLVCKFDHNDQFTNALPLDSNSHSGFYSVYANKMKITYK